MRIVKKVSVRKIILQWSEDRAWRTSVSAAGEMVVGLEITTFRILQLLIACQIRKIRRLDISIIRSGT
jgi:hypothetical protein